jgi:hypothetical protein
MVAAVPSAPAEKLLSNIKDDHELKVKIEGSNPHKEHILTASDVTSCPGHLHREQLFGARSAIFGRRSADQWAT